ncbi:hypothetical protein GALMADRAFT_144519 [Galerina marginata CBS 339.88]|uniref:Uncharacterized protein n=1 Tax=Galerina marginata (strain CBS 339.88) TaxID=685588 RepID=A0A067SI79_GALM3|nr:hypothetical protein GALMADRAFT_144519 [Galerina marginata CBS 339.88]
MPNAFRQTRDRKPVGSGSIQGLVPLESVPLGRRPYGLPHAVVGAQGHVYAPTGSFSQVVGQGNSIERERVEVPLGYEDEEDGGGGADTDDAAKRAGKKQRQWRKWSEDIIPQLLKPYMQLLRETSGLRDIEGVREERGCAGCSDGRLLEVTCVYFERLKKITLC